MLSVEWPSEELSGIKADAIQARGPVDDLHMMSITRVLNVLA